jgi:hypothetical protein
VALPDSELLCLPALDRGIRGLDSESSPFGHCIPGVDGQVEKGALELCRVDFDLPKSAPQQGSYFYGLAERAAQHFAHAANQPIHVQALRRKRLLTRKCQQALGKLRCALCAFDCTLDEALNVNFAFRELSLGKVESANHDGEHVVEVMRYTAGKLANSLHLLCLTQMLLRPGLLRNRLEYALLKRCVKRLQSILDTPTVLNFLLCRGEQAGIIDGGRRMPGKPEQGVLVFGLEDPDFFVPEEQSTQDLA